MPDLMNRRVLRADAQQSFVRLLLVLYISLCNNLVGRARRYKMKKYIVNRFHLSMTKDQHKLEEFLNNLKGEMVAILPNVTSFPGSWSRVDFVLIVEKLR